MDVREESKVVQPARERSLAGLRALRPRRWLLSVIGLIGVLAAGLVYAVLAAREQGSVEGQFRFDAQKRTGAVQHELRRYFDLIGYLVSFYDGSQFVERREFRNFCAPVGRSFRPSRRLGLGSPGAGVAAE